MTARMARDDRRAQLIEAARQVFVERGLAGARTKEIAERAWVSEAMLYRHFATKNELFEAAVLGPLEQWAQEMADAGRQMPVTGRGGRHEMSYQLHLDRHVATPPGRRAGCTRTDQTPVLVARRELTSKKQRIDS